MSLSASMRPRVSSRCRSATSWPASGPLRNRSTGWIGAFVWAASFFEAPDFSARPASTVSASLRSGTSVYSPSFSAAPERTLTGSSSRMSSSSTPLPLPRSSTERSPARSRLSLACRLDTDGSLSRRSASASRPMITSLLIGTLRRAPSGPVICSLQGAKGAMSSEPRIPPGEVSTEALGPSDDRGRAEDVSRGRARGTCLGIRAVTVAGLAERRDDSSSDAVSRFAPRLCGHDLGDPPPPTFRGPIDPIRVQLRPHPSLAEAVETGADTRRRVK